MDELTARIGKGLSDQLDGFKFVKSRWQLLKSTAEGWQAIEIAVLPTSQQGTAKLAAHGQVRLDRIEETYIPFHPYLSRTEAKTHATVTINCDSLLVDCPVVHEFRTDDQSIDMFIVDFANAIKAHVLPWLDQYSNENAVFVGLIDDDPMRWITSDRLVRYPVLLAVLANRNQWSEFDRIAQEFANYCDLLHAQVYKPLADALISGLKKTRK
ncbi:hypothetical protein [Gimesia maris]|uniref:Uncharacterized protein n=1 Tax=Gimesia maris TaxID=122 RepID=A0ABX5YKE8_9PLAN|nr:hypothetical protein [Gimesia maris]EDL57107.1 hypothetical protein PM8797T_01904 [Gimesia maris DSM 8797]QEG16179.1 hypothetical protein GmarT_20400 [Gimesia maris]QGQ30601.1 hypothetical protein F1729_19155 [Gimesia maris]